MLAQQRRQPRLADAGHAEHRHRVARRVHELIGDVEQHGARPVRDGTWRLAQAAAGVTSRPRQILPRGSDFIAAVVATCRHRLRKSSSKINAIASLASRLASLLPNRRAARANGGYGVYTWASMALFPLRSPGCAPSPSRSRTSRATSPTARPPASSASTPTSST